MMTGHDRVAIIGAGHVGSTAAYALMLRALFREIVLIDHDVGLAQAEAADLSDANALARPATIWVGDYSDAASSSIAIITAGEATHGSESRLSVASGSAAIVGQCARDLRSAGFKGVLLVASNPVDLMALVAFRNAGLPAARVIGTGTLLDSNRLRRVLSTRFGVAPQSVEAIVVGEHGDSEVLALSNARVGGRSIMLDDADALGKEVREAGYRIVEGKGYTSFGVATAVVRICEAIVRDERVVLPVSTLLSGGCDIDGIYLSLPCVVGAGGVERVIVPALDDDERRRLDISAQVIRDAIAAMDEASGDDDAGKVGVTNPTQSKRTA